SVHILYMYGCICGHVHISNSVINGSVQCVCVCVYKCSLSYIKHCVSVNVSLCEYECMFAQHVPVCVCVCVCVCVFVCVCVCVCVCVSDSTVPLRMSTCSHVHIHTHPYPVSHTHTHKETFTETQCFMYERE